MGLAPNSPFWEGIQKSVELEDNKISLEFCNYPDHEGIKTNTLPAGELVMVQISPANSVFNFPGKMSYTDSEKNKIERDTKICVENSKNLLFQTLKSLNDIILGKLCKEIYDCTTESDLNDFKKSDEIIKLTMEGKVIHSASLKDGNLNNII